MCCSALDEIVRKIQIYRRQSHGGGEIAADQQQKGDMSDDGTEPAVVPAARRVQGLLRVRLTAQGHHVAPPLELGRSHQHGAHAALQDESTQNEKRPLQPVRVEKKPGQGGVDEHPQAVPSDRDTGRHRRVLLEVVAENHNG